MLQNREHRVTFTAEQSPKQRLEAIKDALIAEGVVRQHALYLCAPGYDDLHVGNWDELFCSDDDLRLATSVLIAW